MNANGRRVDYIPSTGVCHTQNMPLMHGRKEQLRGSPERVAEILEGFIR